jgi:alkylation response protein AidB-like acyl-CoA dehydrogenase
VDESVASEDLEEYGRRAGEWIVANLPRAGAASDRFFLSAVTSSDEEDLARIETCRELQRTLFHGGYAGITVPRAYGGQGLTAAHQATFNRTLRGFDYPAEIQASTFIPCMAILLEFGTEEQKRRHIPAILQGEEIWVQLLSEPGGGSDAAGAVTTAVRDGDQWVLNGSKIWTTGAWYGDWALCLARTNWDVEKHRGLTVFSLPMRGQGVEIHRVELLNGSREFCQEFLSDVVVPDSDRVGDVDAGWTVVTRWLHHERTIAGGSPFVTGTGNRQSEGQSEPRAMLGLARRLGTAGEARTRELIGEAQALTLARRALTRSLGPGMQSGRVSPHAAAVLRLFSGTTTVRKAAIAFEVAGAAGVAHAEVDHDLASVASAYILRQAACIGGGTTEMARNVISERLLGMPRESRGDSGAFRDVPRGSTSMSRPVRLEV